VSRTGPARSGGAGPDGEAGRDRIVLVGFSASGKSTVGRLLAGRLGIPFVDLDEEVEALAGRAIREVFSREGEDVFRALEVRATGAADAITPAVVATGGGWMARPELRDRWPDAVRVWLRVSPPAVLERLGDDLAGRPMLDPEEPEDSVRRLMDARLGAYARAELTVDTDGRSAGEVAARILELLNRR